MLFSFVSRLPFGISPALVADPSALSLSAASFDVSCADSLCLFFASRCSNAEDRLATLSPDEQAQLPADSYPHGRKPIVPLASDPVATRRYVSRCHCRELTQRVID